MPAEAYVAASRAAKNAVERSPPTARGPPSPLFCYRAADRTSKEEANVMRNLSVGSARRPRALWGVAASLAFGLFGCGDDGTSNPATTSTGTGTGTTTGTTTTTSGGGGAGGGAAGACFDYATWDGETPTTTLKADVLPMFRRSCGLSTSCHGAEPGPAPGVAPSGCGAGGGASSGVHAASSSACRIVEPMTAKSASVSQSSRSWLASSRSQLR